MQTLIRSKSTSWEACCILEVLLILGKRLHRSLRETPGLILFGLVKHANLDKRSVGGVRLPSGAAAS
jgi:hypothetical protein